MKSTILSLGILILSISITSCSSDSNDDPYENPDVKVEKSLESLSAGGYYDVLVSLKAKTSVDLNKDGIYSTDLLEENPALSKQHWVFITSQKKYKIFTGSDWSIKANIIEEGTYITNDTTHSIEMTPTNPVGSKKIFQNAHFYQNEAGFGKGFLSFEEVTSNNLLYYNFESVTE